MIAANHPILVAQISEGSTSDGNTNADPFMALVPPYDQFGGSYTLATPASGFATHYVNVVAPTAGIDNAILLDGVAIPGASFTAIGKSAFSGAQIPLGLGSHHLASNTV